MWKKAKPEPLSIEEFDSLATMLVKFNPLVHHDDVCDIIDCDRCPFDHLSPTNEDGDVDTTACTEALTNRLERIREES